MSSSLNMSDGPRRDKSSFSMIGRVLDLSSSSSLRSDTLSVPDEL